MVDENKGDGIISLDLVITQVMKLLNEKKGEDIAYSKIQGESDSIRDKTNKRRRYEFRRKFVILWMNVIES